MRIRETNPPRCLRHPRRQAPAPARTRAARLRHRHPRQEDLAVIPDGGVARRVGDEAAGAEDEGDTVAIRLLRRRPDRAMIRDRGVGGEKTIAVVPVGGEDDLGHHPKL